MLENILLLFIKAFTVYMGIKTIIFGIKEINRNNKADI
jgi:hypothetical protein